MAAQQQAILEPDDPTADTGPVDPGAALNDYDAPSPGERAQRDVVGGRYQLRLDQPISELSGQIASAYAVTDQKDPTRELYATVSPPGTPARLKVAQSLKSLNLPHLCSPIETGVVLVSTLGQCCFVAVFERPKGKRLSDLMLEHKGLPEQTIVKDILRPLSEVLAALHQLGVTHGRINADTIFLGDRLTVGECVSEPCGYSQSFFYESIERLVAQPTGKGEGDGGADCYAAGVLILFLLLGGNPHASLAQQTYAYKVVNLGSYNALVGDRSFSELMLDPLRGLLHDTLIDRWSTSQLQQWLDGKKYNLIQPSIPREASRPFTFHGMDYINRRSLAQGLFAHWKESHDLLYDTHLIRWIELSVLKNDAAENLKRYIRPEGSNRNEKEDDDSIARIMVLLDRSGPIRYKTLAVNIDGIGPALADSFRRDARQEIQITAETLTSDLPSFWSDQQDGNISPGISAVLWRLQKTRSAIVSHALGLGMERCLYDLNPTLPCQSRLVGEYYVLSLDDLLATLDGLAKEKVKECDPMDRHIAAFITSRLEVTKEPRISELDMFPALRSNPQLLALKLLQDAQAKCTNRRHRGLTLWLAERIEPLFSQLHNRGLRTRVRDGLYKAAKTGSLEAMLALLADSKIAREDTLGFQRAAAQYRVNAGKIHALENSEILAYKARKLGLSVVQRVAYFLCVLSIASAVKTLL